MSGRAVRSSVRTVPSVLGRHAGDSLRAAASGTLAGPVETELSDGKARVWAGLREDPFFFDREGFLDTLATESVVFTGADFYEALNVTAVVLELDPSALGDVDSLRLWATTARK